MPGGQRGSPAIAPCRREDNHCHHLDPAAAACIVYWLVADQQLQALQQCAQLSHQDTADSDLYLTGQRQPLGNSGPEPPSQPATSVLLGTSYLKEKTAYLGSGRLGADSGSGSATARVKCFHSLPHLHKYST